MCAFSSSLPFFGIKLVMINIFKIPCGEELNEVHFLDHRFPFRVSY